MRTPITSADQLAGRWTVWATDIPEWSCWQETYEFTEDGYFKWCCYRTKDAGQPIGFFNLHFEITETGIRRFNDDPEKCFHIEAWFEDHLLVLLPSHGYRTWYRRD